MRATYHSGRVNSKGEAFSAKHNDRNFDTSKADNIHESETKDNVYWTWLDEENGEENRFSFSDAESEFYERHLKTAYQAQWLRYANARQYGRMKSFDDWQKMKSHCPEEFVLQVGKTGDTIDRQKFIDVANDYMGRLMQWSKDHGNPFTVLDVAIHVDESVPHLQARRVWTYETEDGYLTTGQEKALERAGVERPEPNEANSRRNNRKVTFSQMERDMWLDTLRAHGLDIETSKQAPKRSMSKGEWLAQYAQELDEREADLAFRDKLVTNATRRVNEADKASRERAAELKECVADLDEREAALDSREDALKERSTALDNREHDLDARETALNASQSDLENKRRNFGQAVEEAAQKRLRMASKASDIQKARERDLELRFGF